MAKTLKEELTGLAREETYGKFESWCDNNRAVIVNTDTRKVVKRFKGESAWSNANRIAGDLHFAERNASW